MEFIIISGMSGAGKSKAASFLEDIGFYVVAMALIITSLILFFAM